MKFLTVFPDCRNIHLIKDVGMIPYYFHKVYGFDSAILTYRNDSYDFLQTAVKGLTLTFLDGRKPNKTKEVEKVLLEYVSEHAGDIDVLNVYDISGTVMRLAELYKKRNPNGKVYVKLDRGINYGYSKNPLLHLRERRIESHLMRHDFVSVESTLAVDFFQRKTLMKPSYIPNGYVPHPAIDTQKKKVILFVGDISIHPKRLDIVISAFSRLRQDSSDRWTLRLVGPLKDDFKEWSAMSGAELTANRDIEVVPPIYDRTLLEKEYASSSIIILASDHESFGIVLAEALSFKCIPVVSSGVSSANDITDNGNCGYVFEKGSVESCAAQLSTAIEWHEDHELRERCGMHARNFSWETIVRRIHQGLGL